MIIIKMDDIIREFSSRYIFRSLDKSIDLIKKANKSLNINHNLGELIGKIIILDPCDDGGVVQIFNYKNKNMLIITEKELNCENIIYEYHKENNFNQEKNEYYRPLSHIIFEKYIHVISPIISKSFEEDKVYFEDSIEEYVLNRSLWSKIISSTLLYLFDNYYNQYNMEINHILDELRDEYLDIETIINNKNGFRENIVKDTLYHFLKYKTEIISLVISRKYYEKYGSRSIDIIKNNMWVNENKDIIRLKDIIDDSVLEKVKNDEYIQKIRGYKLKGELINYIERIESI